MKDKPQKPKLNTTVVGGSFYWVTPFQGDEFEPAKARDRYENGELYFCFTNGSVLEVERAWEVEPLNFS